MAARGKPRRLVVAGVMSGTSADGIDVALCRVGPREGQPPRLQLLAHHSVRYTKAVRAMILAAASDVPMAPAELARLHWRLGQLYADAVEQAIATHGVQPQLLAVHGQTIYHQAAAKGFLGAPVRCTWQLGEAAVVAERLRLPVVSDLRPADLAAGGQGAPLVPMLDYALFRHARRNRVLLNLGGIANLTALPAGCAAEEVLAFDTGPANMLLDALAQQLFGEPFDRNGRRAGAGRVLPQVLDALLRLPYFAAAPPKSCGREQFGPAYVQRLTELFDRAEARAEDRLATTTALTSHSIVEAYRRFVWPHLGQCAPLARGTDLLIAGGGAYNRTLVDQLTALFEPLGVRVSTTAAAGLPVQAKEAAAFALLGWLSWHGLPGNLPSATGASHAAVLGKVSDA